jgi:tetratricopeptide (TPR) repeat protein
MEEEKLSIWTAQGISNGSVSFEELMERGKSMLWGMIGYWGANLQAAFIYYNKAQEIAPARVEVYRQLAYCYRDSKDYANAILQAKTVIRMDPSNADGYWLLAHMQAYSGYYEEAIKNLRKAIALHPSEYLYWRDLAIDYSYNNQHDNAINTISDAPWHGNEGAAATEYYEVSAYIYRRAGKYHNAIRASRKWIIHFVKERHYHTFNKINDFFVCSDSFSNNYLIQNYKEMANDYYNVKDTIKARKIWKWLESRNIKGMTAEQLKDLFQKKDSTNIGK